MARLRTVKSEFWTSEQVLSCSPSARLLFIGCWNFCDDNGIHPASLVRLRAEVFPCGSFSIDEIRAFIDELTTNNLLQEYIADDAKAYWIVTGWTKHQRIDKPTYKHPLPSADLKAVTNSSTSSRVLDECSSNVSRGRGNTSSNYRQLLDDSSPPEWSGVEQSGVDNKPCEADTSLVGVGNNDDVASNSKLSGEVTAIFTHWQLTLNHPRAKLDQVRKRKITQALKLGYTLEQLKQAIDGCAKTPYNMGENDRNQVYDDIGLILRDAAHIERFIKNATSVAVDRPGNATDNLMRGAI